MWWKGKGKGASEEQLRQALLAFATPEVAVAADSRCPNSMSIREQLHGVNEACRETATQAAQTAWDAEKKRRRAGPEWNLLDSLGVSGSGGGGSSNGGGGGGGGGGGVAGAEGTASADVDQAGAAAALLAAQDAWTAEKKRLQSAVDRATGETVTRALNMGRSSGGRVRMVKDLDQAPFVPI
jgi:hypothetical protein